MNHSEVAGARYHAFAFFAVSILTVAAFLPFVDFDYSISFQYDTPIFSEHGSQFIAAWKQRNPDLLPKLEAWPSYFDAYTVIVALLTVATEAFASMSGAVRLALPTEAERLNFWIRWVALGCFGFGMGFLWLALERINHRPFIHLVLVLLVAFTPVVMEMDMGRNDFAVLGGVCAALYFLFSICRCQHAVWSLAGLSVTVALLATLKLNGPAFGLFYLVALVVLWRTHRLSLRNVLWLTVPGVLLCAFFGMRQIYYITDVIPNLQAQFEDLGHWAEGSPNRKWLFYSWHILEGQGVWFRWLVWASLPIAAAYTFIVRRSELFAFMAIYIAFLGMSMAVNYAFSRGGYHLLPMFVVLISIAIAGVDAALLRYNRRPLAAVVWTLVIAMLLAEPMRAATRNYLRSTEQCLDRSLSVYLTRFSPGRWIDQNVPSGSRITHLISNELPFRPPYDVTRLQLDQRFLLPEGRVGPYATYEPPSIETLRAGGDYLIVSDWQRGFLFWRLESNGHNELLQRWQTWFNWMDKHVPSIRFNSPRIGYNYRQLDIFLLAPDPDIAAIEKSVAELDDHVVLRAGDMTPRALP